MQHLSRFLLHQRGFWLRLPMSELSELYAAMMLKTFGLSLIGIFVPIYLYQEGFTITEVVGFMIMCYIVRIMSGRFLARLAYRYGPKRIMRWGLMLTVIFLLMLLSINQVNWPLGLLAVADGIAISLFYMGYHIDFSQAKKLEEFGKEAERVFTSAKIASASAPFIGGLIATLVAPQATIATALVAIGLAAWPLSRGASSPVKPISQVGSFWQFKRYHRSYVSAFSLGVDSTASLVFWPFFAALFIFSGEIYLELGLVTSISAFFAILVVHAMGRLIDNHRGGLLLTYSTWLLSLLHLLRTVAHSFLQVLGINVLNEWFSAGSHMPYLKGMYDESDHAEDRAVYISAMEVAVNAGRLLFWLVVGLGLIVSQSDEAGMQASFLVAALLTPLILRHNFVVLKDEAKS